ncbi:MAG: hypothetical protein A2X94_12755 [Bdellovibrionales bacterium GWB1_55_8]|nr:MAG: hypothetical protein A2X94_12755 [Bdellovibrionales bacterium GWB1_55_8]
MLQRRFQTLTALVAFSFSQASAAEKPADLQIYAYDSFVAAGGLGPEILPIFEARCGCRVRALSSGDAGQLLTRLQLDAERGSSGAQLVIGLDQRTWEQAKPFLEEWGKWSPEGYSQVLPEVKVGSGFLPFDHGYFALIADQEALSADKLSAPSSLQDLRKSEWKRNILLQDPRTSTPGLAFLLYTKAVLGDGVWDFWRDLRTQWLTLTPGWDAAYSMFLRKEAPLVWSYTTSEAYHVEHGGNRMKNGQSRYEAVLFREGQPVQIEGAALVKRGIQTETQRKLAREFLEFLLSSDVQSRIPLRNWMFPVRRNVKLPKSFQDLRKPAKLVKTSDSASDARVTLGEWARIVAGGAKSTRRE